MIRINTINRQVVDEFREIFGEFSPITVVDTYGSGENCDIELSKQVLLISSNAEAILFYRGRFVRLSTTDFLNIEIQ